VQRPRGLAPPSVAEGGFGKDFAVAELLADLWRQKTSGRIDFVSGRRQRAIFFDRGQPVAAFSSEPYDRMEEYLLRLGRITKAQYNQVRIKQLRGARQIGAFLVSEGFLKSQELFGAVRGCILEVIYGLFEWEAASFTYRPEVIEDDDRVGLDLDVPAMVFEGIRRKYLLPRLLERVGSPSSLLAPRPGARESMDLDGLGLTPAERKVVRGVDGTRSIDDLVFTTGLEPQSVYVVLGALLSLGWAEVVVRGEEGINRDGSSAADTIDSNRIKEKLRAVRELDYFAVLGVSRSATPFEMERAFERLSQEYAPDNFSEQIRRDFHDGLAEIEEVLTDAYAVLRDDNLRQSYARNLP